MNEEPISVSSMVSLLILLLTVQPMLAGCTVMNYAIGQSYDEKHAVKVELESVNQVEPGQAVVLRFHDGRDFEGKLKAWQDEESLIVTHFVFFNNVWSERDTVIAKESVERVWREDLPTGGRSAGFLVGVLMDLGILAFIAYVRAMRSLNNTLD